MKPQLSSNAQLVSAIFEELAKGKGLTRDGQRYDNDYAFVIHFRDGKIARYEEYCDTDLIARVLPDRLAAKSMLERKK